MVPAARGSAIARIIEGGGAVGQLPFWRPRGPAAADTEAAPSGAGPLAIAGDLC